VRTIVTPPLICEGDEPQHSVGWGGGGARARRNESGKLPAVGMAIPVCMGMGTARNSHGHVRIPRRFLNGSETKRKRIKHVRDKCRSRWLNFAKYSQDFFFTIITE